MRSPASERTISKISRSTILILSNPSGLEDKDDDIDWELFNQNERSNTHGGNILTGWYNIKEQTKNDTLIISTEKFHFFVINMKICSYQEVKTIFYHIHILQELKINAEIKYKFA